MILGEYGNTLRIQANEDISANTNTLYLESPPPVVSKLVIVSPELTIGAITQTLDGINYVADEYVEYEITITDFKISGVFKACLHSLTPGGKNKIIGPVTFTLDVC